LKLIDVTKFKMNQLKKITVMTLVTASLIALLPAQVTSRTSFDADWKFARFGKMAGGAVLPEPGEKPSAIRASTTQDGQPPFPRPSDHT
jgi:hypothetical protein